LTNNYEQMQDWVVNVDTYLEDLSAAMKSAAAGAKVTVPEYTKPRKP
jgi:hypothetical protein